MSDEEGDDPFAPIPAVVHAREEFVKQLVEEQKDLVKADPVETGAPKSVRELKKALSTGEERKRMNTRSRRTSEAKRLAQVHNPITIVGAIAPEVAEAPQPPDRLESALDDDDEERALRMVDLARFQPSEAVRRAVIDKARTQMELRTLRAMLNQASAPVPAYVPPPPPPPSPPRPPLKGDPAADPHQDGHHDRERDAASSAATDGGAAADTDESGAAGEDDAATLELLLRAPGQPPVRLRVFASEPLQAVFGVVCSKIGVDPGRAQLQFDGRRLDLSRAPSQLELEDGDQVDLVVR